MGQANNVFGIAMSLRASYTLLAPLYDLIVARATAASRARSLAALADLKPASILLSGIGTGLDLPHAPTQHRYVGLDLTAAMLARATSLRSGPGARR